MLPSLFQNTFPVRDYDLAATLSSGQAFRWRLIDGGWEGVVGARWVRLTAGKDEIAVQTSEAVTDWGWLEHYLQIGVDLNAVLARFPDDEPLRTAVAACRGLRLLRQDPWECLASFILSSTKQIVQIQQIVELVTQRFGTPLAVPSNRAPVHSFPAPERIAELNEEDLRACKMGFRAPYLLGAARLIADRQIELESIRGFELERARAELMRLPGVGRKIADCVLLFGFGFQSAFPVDVWILKALRELYFRKRKVSPKKLLRFTESYFGAHSGYAQQYLFHYMRLRDKAGRARTVER
jgi:N-glycosylase/DNA lyase